MSFIYCHLNFHANLLRPWPFPLRISYFPCDIVQPAWYNISALIRCNFIIKNYVNRKITSYIYLLIFTISLWLHVKHFIALTKRESVRRIFYYTIPVVRRHRQDKSENGLCLLSPPHWRQPHSPNSTLWYTIFSIH
jgi:hypothetical protein